MSHANKTTSVPAAFSSNFAKILRNVAILALEDQSLREKLKKFRAEQARKVLAERLP